MTSPSPTFTTSSRTAWLEVLPSELLVEVASSLDLRSTLALAATSTSLSTILTTTTEWNRILNKMSDARLEKAGKKARTFRKQEEEVAELASFLRVMKESDELFDHLLHFIGTKFSSTNSHITLTCSLHQHEVSPQGVHLLHLATSAMSAEPWTITEVQVHRLRRPILASLASWVGRQEQEVPSLHLKRLKVRTTRKEMEACMGLLERCATWEIGCFTLFTSFTVICVKEEVGEFWWRLAAASERGRLKRMETTRDVMGMGELKDVRKAWEATEFLDMFAVGDELELEEVFVNGTINFADLDEVDSENVEDDWEKVVEMLEWEKTCNRIAESLNAENEREDEER